MFRQQADKSELPGATHGFLPEEAAKPPLEALRGDGYPQISPSFRDDSPDTHTQHGQTVPTATLAGDSRYSWFPNVKTSYTFGIPCLLSSGATRLVPRFFPTGASIEVCREFRTFGAPPRAPGLGLGPFSLVGAPRGSASRLAPAGIPAGTSVPFVPPRKGCNPLVHRGPTDSIQFSGCVADNTIMPAAAGGHAPNAVQSPQFPEVVRPDRATKNNRRKRPWPTR